MSEKGGFPHEPPPNYSPPGGHTNSAFAGSRYAPQYGAQHAQFGQPQPYGIQGQQMSAVVVTQPGMNHQAVYGHVPDHMGLAIFVTICCFWPLGIVAIMRASEARTALSRGDVAGAQQLSAQAKRLSMWTIAAGVGAIVVAIIIVVVVVVRAVNECYYCY